MSDAYNMEARYSRLVLTVLRLTAWFGTVASLECRHAGDSVSYHDVGCDALPDLHARQDAEAQFPTLPDCTVSYGRTILMLTILTSYSGTVSSKSSHIMAVPLEIMTASATMAILLLR